MSDPTKTTKKLKSRTERELEAMGEGSTPAPKKQTPRAAPETLEKRTGVGTDNTEANARALGAQLRAKIKAAEAAGNTSLAEKLRARLKEMQEAK